MLKQQIHSRDTEITRLGTLLGQSTPTLWNSNATHSSSLKRQEKNDNDQNDSDTSFRIRQLRESSPSKILQNNKNVPQHSTTNNKIDQLQMQLQYLHDQIETLEKVK